MPRQTRLLALTSLALATVALSAGCGPFGYLKKVAKESTKAVADAQAVGAEEYAPYEYWGAVSYLEQAKTMMAYSEYERSFDYGVRAKQLADEAKKKAEMREAGRDVQTTEDEDGGAGGTEAAGSAEGEASGGKAEGKAEGKIELGGGK